MSKAKQKTFKSFWREMSKEQKADVAAQAGTSVAYLRQVLTCGRKPGAAMAKRIEQATKGVVSCQELRPDIFADMVAA